MLGGVLPSQLSTVQACVFQHMQDCDTHCGHSPHCMPVQHTLHEIQQYHQQPLSACHLGIHDVINLHLLSFLQ